MRKIVIGLISLLVSISITTSVSAAEEKKKIAAVVNGDQITLEEINRTIQYLPQYQKLQLEILENLIVNTLIYQESVKAGIKVEDGEVEKGFKEYVSKFSIDESVVKAEMKRLNITEEIMKKEITKQLMVERFLKEKSKDVDLSVKDEEVKQFYDERPDTFSKPDRLTVSHILIKTGPGSEKAENEAALKKINEVKEKLTKGADFGELAKQYSEDPVTAQSGGTLKNPVTKQSPLPKSFIDSAFSLEINKVSEPVKSVVGYHLVKVTEKKPAAITPFSEVKESLKYRLMERKNSIEMKKYVDSLVEKSDIKILIENRKKP